MSKVLPPFHLQYSTQVPELLTQMGCTIAVSTYQAGKVIFISPKDEHSLIQLPRSFAKAMGIALEGDKLAIACKEEVILLNNSAQLGKFYPKKPGVYDAMFMPRVTYHTGAIDVHDIDFCNEGICAVNTQFSCIIKIDENYSFTPIWKPDFISKIVAEDRCHLNGMAVENGTIKYVTAFSQTDECRKWKDNLATTGVVIDYKTKEIITSGLGMPHSPRMINGNLYVLLSATGELIKVDTNTGKYETVIQIDGFVRGLSYHEGYAFIGLSKLRKNASSFGQLAIAEKATHSGITIVHLETGALAGRIIYGSSVDEIYDVQIIPNLIRPSILNTIKEDYKLGLSIPETTFWAHKKPE